jgi:predicted amidophosphoribosyltransferase
MPHLFLCQGCSYSVSLREAPLCKNCRDHLIPAKSLCQSCGAITCPPLNCQRPWARHACIQSFAAHYLAIGQSHEIIRRWKTRSGPLFDHLILNSISLRTSPTFNSIVPIPQLLNRGFHLGRNPARKVALALAKKYQVPVVDALRVRELLPQRQAQLSLYERTKTPNRFELNEPCLLGRSVLLVDDFMTSGHTLRRAADILQSARIQEIHVFCLAARPKLSSQTQSRNRLLNGLSRTVTIR